MRAHANITIRWIAGFTHNRTRVRNAGRTWNYGTKAAEQSPCEILGLDPLYVANEGKLLAILATEDADRVLKVLRSHCLGKDAAVIGEVVTEHPGLIMMKTRVGGTRVVDMLSGEQLPRIC